MESKISNPLEHVNNLIKENKDILFLTEDKKGRSVIHRTTNAWFASQLHLHHFGITTKANVNVSFIPDNEKDKIEVCNTPDCILFYKNIKHQYN
jgi:hypothetical protein